MRNWLSAKRQSVADKFKELTDETEREAQECLHLGEIYDKVAEKAKFLIMLEPAKQISTQPQISRGLSTLGRKPSYVRSQSSFGDQT